MSKFALIIIQLFSIAFKAIAFRSYRVKDILNSDKSAEYHGYSKDQEDIEVAFLEQQLDHYNPYWNESVRASLRQRYFYSNRYVSKNTSLPVYAFLCVGGEGPALDRSVLVDSVHCSGDMLELARLLNETASVHLFALEHRYYGESYPNFLDDEGNYVSPLATKNLVFLSSKQALADVANFIMTRNFPPLVKWVTFGGSYPGFLAGMTRAFYPHLVHAAVSSSAPIHFIEDFVGYKEHQAWTLEYAYIGGRPECLNVISDGHKDLINAMELDRTYVADLFSICDKDAFIQERNVQMFLGDGVVNIPSQDNDPYCEEDLCNIEKICDFLLESQAQGDSQIVSLAMLSKNQQSSDCITVDWKSLLSNITSEVIEKEHWRSWLWQTCTEFGYYQTCELDSNCPFGRGYHSLDMDIEICRVAFDINDITIQENIEATKKWYGNKLRRATRILSVNGDVDPWSVLAMLKSKDPWKPAHVVKGASHHAWTHPIRECDSKEVQDARQLIYQTILQWLTDPVNTAFTVDKSQIL
jgi:thymus-specific serine protease